MIQKKRYLSRKRKSKRKSRKIQRGGEPFYSTLAKKINFNLKKYKDRKVNIYIKELMETYSKTPERIPEMERNHKVCHHYSLFSLIGNNAPIEINKINNELITKDTDMTKHITEPGPFTRGTFKIRLLKFNKSNSNKGYTPHSARFDEGGKLWHKFADLNCIISIELMDGTLEEKEDVKNFGYATIQDIDITSYEVPDDMFVFKEVTKSFTIGSSCLL